jgi:hypothetical protein
MMMTHKRNGSGIINTHIHTTLYLRGTKKYIGLYFNCRLTPKLASVYKEFHTYIPLTLDLRRGGRDVSDMPLRRPRFTKNT